MKYILLLLFSALPAHASYVPTVNGTYTPTITNGTNVAASTAFVSMYQRIGNRVRVSMLIGIDATAAGGAASALTISLPIDPANNFAADENAAGVLAKGATGSTTAAGGLSATIGAKTVSVGFLSFDTPSRTFLATFEYILQ